MDSRRHARQKVWIPVRLDDGRDRPRLGVTYDVSERGLRVSTHTRFEVGETVAVTIGEGTASPPATLRGRIVRIEPNTDDPDGLWPQRMAVELDEPLGDLEQRVRRLLGG